MGRGLYTAASAMLAGLERQLSLANMVANVNTPGFKGDQTTTRSFPSVLAMAGGGGAARLGSGVLMEHVGVDLRPGPLQATGSPWDMGLEGAGFFVVEDANGGLRLTRDGHLVTDTEGFLATTSGHRLLSQENAPLQVGNATAEIGRDGAVFVEGERIGTIRVVTAPADGLLRAGGSSFVVVDAGALEPATPEVVQGSLEGSNVNTTQALTAMVSVARAYESAQRIFTMQNQILARTVSEVGRV